MRITPASRLRSSGFTLIEMVIGAALMAMILAAAYACLNAGFAGQKLIEPRAGVFQNARVAMTMITEDLRAACPLSKDYPFLGMQRTLGLVEADNLDFGTHHYNPRHAREGDFCQESFFLEKDREPGQYSLWRRRNPLIGLNPVSGGSREQIARGLLGLQFEYYDGLDWYATWGDIEMNGKQKTSLRVQPNMDGMPEAVRVTLTFDSEPRPAGRPAAASATNGPPLVFQTVARLNLAAASSLSASAAGTDDPPGPANAGQPGGPAKNGGGN
jgi:prepilin-type N-terminal cleavage/methylation domain-containing protein